MAVQIASHSPPQFPPPHASSNLPSRHLYGGFPSPSRCRRPALRSGGVSCQLSGHRTARQVSVPSKASRINRSLLSVSEACSEAELVAAAFLRVRTFYNFNPETYGIDDHKRYLAEHEFEALKERVAGKRKGFKRVSCINATLPMSVVLPVSSDLCASCKFAQNGENRVVVGTLDLNQCIQLPDEITGMKPKGIGADFARAYISNVCVAKELHRNGLGYELVSESKSVAEDWGQKLYQELVHIWMYILVKTRMHVESQRDCHVLPKFVLICLPSSQPKFILKLSYVILSRDCPSDCQSHKQPPSLPSFESHAPNPILCLLSIHARHGHFAKMMSSWLSRTTFLLDIFLRIKIVYEYTYYISSLQNFILCRSSGCELQNDITT